MKLERASLTITNIPWVPPHAAHDEARVEAILADLREHGWRGRPLLISSPSGEVDGSCWAWTGSHRACALARLIEERGAAPVEVLLLVAESRDDLGELEWARACQVDQDRREEVAEELADIFGLPALLDAIREERAAAAAPRV